MSFFFFFPFFEANRRRKHKPPQTHHTKSPYQGGLNTICKINQRASLREGKNCDVVSRFIFLKRYDINKYCCLIEIYGTVN